jgi:SSS family solute:Na+ symporter
MEGKFMSSIVKLLFIFGFLFVISGIILITAKKAKSSKDFYLAGGKLQWYVVTGTILATLTGGGTIVGYVGSYYNNGLVWIWVGIGSLIAGLIIALISEKIYGLGKATVGDIVGIRYGEGTKFLTGLILIVSELAVVCAMTAAFTGSIAAATGINPLICRAIGVALFVLTAIYGGFRGVAITDAIQAVVILLGVIIAGCLAVGHIGGFSEFLSKIDPIKLNPLNGTIPMKVMFGNVISLIGLNLVNQAAFFQRISACKSPSDSKKSVFGYLILQFVLFVVMIPLLGLTASVILPADVKPDSVIVMLLETVSHPVFSLFYTVLIISATLTTANSLLLSCSMSFTMNVLDKISKKPVDDQKKVVIGKVFVVIGGIFAFAVATFVPSVIGLLMMAYTIMCIIVVPLYLGIFTKLGGKQAGFWSLFIGGTVTFILELLKRPFGVHPSLISLPVTLAVFMLFALLGDRATDQQLEMVESMKQA